MPQWTNEQQEAIYIRNQNVLVSAGAGSGKTAVLTERVYQMIKEGYHLDEFVVLTFTKAAAFEMRERIRKKLLADPTLEALAPEVDTSYITTFDAFALSLVKKYHYLLDIEKDVSITDEAFVRVMKRNVLSQILEEYYQNPTPTFKSLIAQYAFKNDQVLRDFFLKIDALGDLKIDREAYFSTYISHFFHEEKIRNDIVTFYQMIQNQLREVLEASRALEDGEDQQRIVESIQTLLSYPDYDQLFAGLLGYVFPRAKRATEEKDSEQAQLRKQIKDQIYKIKRFTQAGNSEQILSSYMETKEWIALCIEIVMKLEARMTAYKKEQNVYTFMDIAKMGLSLLDHPLVREELRMKLKAIMVDEYQDTSDIQEAFLQKLSDQNLYMVGDIKQSIYRFRNANCTLFLEKYQQYSHGQAGRKIDLNQNFRSREEVIQDMNHLFSHIMTQDFGGANYAQEHRILFGNRKYQKEGKSGEDYHLQILCYEEKNRKEEEAKYIAEDILSKIGTYPIFDKDSGTFHPATYRDFAILMDRKSSFDLYRKVFEQYHLPIRIEKDEELISSPAILVLQSLLKLYQSIIDRRYDANFEHAFASVYRSFLYQGKDEELENTIIQHDYETTDLFQKLYQLGEEGKKHSLSWQVIAIIEAFSIEEKLILIGNVEQNERKIEHLLESIVAMEKMGFTMTDFIAYLTDSQQYQIALTSSYEDDGSDSIRLLSIHKSKGLEFPIVYYSGLSSAFHHPDIKTNFMTSQQYGILLPLLHEQGEGMYQILVREEEKREELSEKIRLFYVALSRAKEKMILLSPVDYQPCLCLSQSRSLLDLLFFAKPSSHAYQVVHHTESPVAFHENTKEEEDVPPLLVKEISIASPQPIQKKRASMLVVEKEEAALSFGEHLHFLLESVDLKHPDTSFIRDPQEKRILDDFFHSAFYQKLRTGELYQEYRYIDDMGQEGIIDLLCILKDEVWIVDFKTASLEKEAYLSQLATYRQYIESVLHQPCRCFLYSLLKREWKEI